MADKGRHACCMADRGHFGLDDTTLTTAAGAARPPHAPALSRTRAAPEGMVFIPGGEFLMGTDDQEGFPADGEGPVRRVRVKPFQMDRTTVTNAQFAEFVKATGYKTE